MSQEFARNKGQEDDYMLGVMVNSADNRTELEKQLDHIAQELQRKYQRGKLQTVLEDAIDIILYVSYPNKETIGFDIGITTGGPNISLVYDRGVCQLRGARGSVTDAKIIDNEICEKILDYLSS